MIVPKTGVFVTEWDFNHTEEKTEMHLINCILQRQYNELRKTKSSIALC